MIELMILMNIGSMIIFGILGIGMHLRDQRRERELYEQITKEYASNTFKFKELP
tara:strand:+ start:75 stop:236 length:162 start_codon:yes stop_codon:yes gene_type:complete